MSLALLEYRNKLVNRILVAGSQDEVKNYIDTAMKSFKCNKENEHLVSLFVNKIIAELNLFSPMNKDAQQWSNITMARILFNRFKCRDDAIAN